MNSIISFYKATLIVLSVTFTLTVEGGCLVLSSPEFTVQSGCGSRDVTFLLTELSYCELLSVGGSLWI